MTISNWSTEKLLAALAEGYQLQLAEAEELAAAWPLAQLMELADRLRAAVHGNSLDLCSIINAKSGKCSENCKFCAQSAHYHTEVQSYSCIDEQEALRQGLENEAAGVARFSLVTAGRSISDESLPQLLDIYRKLGEKSSLALCASMGFLSSESARQLCEAGVTRYHCNLESCRSFFPQVCTSHSWEEKLTTIAIAREAGLEICSGGIIGMGESRRQRLELACELRDLAVLSIPINILTPIPGTPLADIEAISREEVLRTVAMFRLINTRAVIRMAGGRGMLGEEQQRLFQAGANGAIVGNYLTTAGRTIDEDCRMFSHLGFTLPQLNFKKRLA